RLTGVDERHTFCGSRDIHQNVDATVPARDALDSSLHLPPVAHITYGSPDTPAGLGQFARRAAQHQAINVHDHHVCALMSESGGNGFANPLCPTDHNGDLATESLWQIRIPVLHWSLQNL